MLCSASTSDQENDVETDVRPALAPVHDISINLYRSRLAPAVSRGNS